MSEKVSTIDVRQRIGDMLNHMAEHHKILGVSGEGQVLAV